MTDYKRAVELAGWKQTRLGNQRITVFVPDYDPTRQGLIRIGYLDEQHIKDALAAQLYRQCVDAGEQVAWLCNGEDTISEILESRVLDSQETK